MSKVLVLSGSPRLKGNTNHLVGYLEEGLKTNKHEVIVIDASRVRTIGCRACEACFRNGKPCIFDEGFNEIAQKIIDADIIVFASPVYWCSFPSQLKAVIDKMYCLMKKPELVNGKKSALIAVCAEEELEEFNGIKQTYESIMQFMGWTSIGEMLIPNKFECNEEELLDELGRVMELVDKVDLNLNNK